MKQVFEIVEGKTPQELAKNLNENPAHYPVLIGPIQRTDEGIYWVLLQHSVPDIEETKE